MIESDRLITVQGSNDEECLDRAIRPKRLKDYVGQKELRQ
jgi:Holliday junction resolvasome, helicase subunit